MWDQLSVTESLSQEAGVQLLQLGGGALFPGGGTDLKGRLLIRKCYLDLAVLMEQHFARDGHIFIITGNPGKALSCQAQADLPLHCHSI